MSDRTIIPFPLNPLNPLNTPEPVTADCPFQAQVELRLAMLLTLFKALAQAQVRPELANDVEGQCRYARELLLEVAELYRPALADAARRSSHA